MTLTLSVTYNYNTPILRHSGFYGKRRRPCEICMLNYLNIVQNENSVCVNLRICDFCVPLARFFEVGVYINAPVVNPTPFAIVK